jgi:hypothetical protein
MTRLPPRFRRFAPSVTLRHRWHGL